MTRKTTFHYCAHDPLRNVYADGTIEITIHDDDTDRTAAYNLMRDEIAKKTGWAKQSYAVISLTPIFTQSA